MAFTIDDMKTKLRALLGAHENSDSDLQKVVARTEEFAVDWEWPEARAAAATGALVRHVDSASKSLSQPWAPLPVFLAPFPVRLKSATFALRLSATLTNTASTSFGVLLTKVGGNNGSGSLSYTASATAFLAGLTTDSGKNPSKSWSWSALTTNLAGAPNPMHLATGSAVSKLDIQERDVVRMQVTKGQAGNDAGARFLGGKLTLVFEKIKSGA